MNFQAKLLFCPDTGEAMDLIVDQWNQLGIKTVYALAQQIERHHIANSLANFEGDKWIVIQTLLETESGFPLAVTDKGEPAIGSGDGSWLKMLCPRGSNSDGISISEYRSEQIHHLVKTHAPHGISLDFIRHFVFWESIYESTESHDIPRSCFCSTCRNQFAQQFDLDLPENEQESINLILNSFLAEWEQFTIQTITELVNTLRSAAREINPQIKINIHVVPWFQNEFDSSRSRKVGQDLDALAQLADQISPMCYSPMLKRPISWIHDLVRSMSEQITVPVIPAIQICEMYGTPALTNEQFSEMIATATAKPSAAVVIWPWERITASQFEILKSNYRSN